MSLVINDSVPEPEINIDQLLNFINSKTRTKLHNQSTNSWFRKHCLPKVKLNYLYYPDELSRHESLKEIFQFFGNNDKKNMDRTELHQMFKDLNINIKSRDLGKIFKTIDKDKDSTLNFKEFKNCTISEECNNEFNKIMKKIRNSEQENQELNKNPYIPLSFGSLITHISYQTMRKQVLKSVVDKSLDINIRAKKFLQLFALHNSYSNDIETNDSHKLKDKIDLKYLAESDPIIKQYSRQLTTLNLTRNRNLSHFSNFNDETGSKIFKNKSVRNSIVEIQESINSSIKKEKWNFNTCIEESDEEAEDFFNKAIAKGKKEAIKNFEYEKSIIPKEKISTFSHYSIPKENKKIKLNEIIIPGNLKRIDQIMKYNLKITKYGNANKVFRKLLGQEKAIKERQIKFYPFLKDNYNTQSDFSSKTKSNIGKKQKIVLPKLL